jgi:hypothetical protein
MQIYPVGLLAVFQALPESPRWFFFHDKHEDAKKSLVFIEGEDEGKKMYDEMAEASEREADETVTYLDMLTPGHAQFHPTVITIMGQVNQALTGYGGKFQVNRESLPAMLTLAQPSLSTVLRSSSSSATGPRKQSTSPRATTFPTSSS